MDTAFPAFDSTMVPHVCSSRDSDIEDLNLGASFDWQVYATSPSLASAHLCRVHLRRVGESIKIVSKTVEVIADLQVLVAITILPNLSISWVFFCQPLADCLVLFRARANKKAFLSRPFLIATLPLMLKAHTTIGHLLPSDLDLFNARLCLSHHFLIGISVFHLCPFLCLRCPFFSFSFFRVPARN